MNSGQGETPGGEPATVSASPPRIELKKILVPLDFSSCSNKALDYAVAFARQFRASVALIHVLELNYVGSSLGEIDVPLLEGELRQNAAEQLELAAERCRAFDVACEATIRSGRPWNEIVEAARDLDVDLVIMGTHGYTGLKHVVMGSTAERVVRHAPCPVLIVREKEHEFIREPQKA